MKSLRTLLAAETTFQSTIGRGEYGTLKELHTTKLIDDDLARGTKHGYLFTIVIKKSTMTTHPAIDLVARPGEYEKTGRRSFYLTEAGILLTSEEKDAPLSSMRPFATGGGEKKPLDPSKVEQPPATEINEDENAINISANESSVIEAMLAIHSAEAKYIAKAGAGTYGTLEQLEKAGLIDKPRLAAIQQSYLLDVKVNAGKDDSPATFSVSAAPKVYGESGRRAFFLDQTSIIRGGDKEGGAADATDPPIR
jgi:hypothetical protein